jgi:hypothetical protein
MSTTSQGVMTVPWRGILRWSRVKQKLAKWLSRIDGYEGGKEKLNSERSGPMRKYLPIALALAIFATTPALARTIHHSAKRSTQNLQMSATAPSQGAPARVGPHNSVGAPNLDCIQHLFGINIALAC